MNDSPAVILYDVTGIEVGTSGNPLRIDPTGTTTQPVSAAALPLPIGAATEATLATRASETTLAAINTKTPALGQAAMAASTPVVIASNQSAVPVSDPKASISAVTSVAQNAASVTVLAANANRLGAMLFNNSTSLCYVKFGATASTTSFTVRMASQGYYEVPFNYTGRIDAVWAAAGGGAMRVTELTA